MVKRTTPLYVDPNGVMVIPSRDDDLIRRDQEVDLFAATASQIFPLGTVAYRGTDVFVYSKNAAVELHAGHLTQQAAIAGADFVKDLAVAAAAAIGAKSVTLTNTATTAITADLFKEGELFVNDVDGEGQCARIYSNPAAAKSASCVFTLYDALTVALTTSSQAGVRRNLYDSVIVCPATTQSGAPVGVPRIVVPASRYFWLQVAGTCAVLTNGTLVLGNPVTVSVTTAGAVDPYNEDGTGNLHPVGICQSVAASTEYSLIKLLLL